MISYLDLVHFQVSEARPGAPKLEQLQAVRDLVFDRGIQFVAMEDCAFPGRRLRPLRHPDDYLFVAIPPLMHPI